MIYPGRVIQSGEADAAIVQAIRTALAARGYALPAEPGFGARLRSVVMLFQSQHVDAAGQPLRVDGKLGPLTWNALFPPSTAAPAAATGVAGQALSIARRQIGQMEAPIGSNRGPMVDEYQRAAGLPLSGSGDGFFWCMAFVFWCFRETGANPNPFPKTAGCLDAWRRVKRTTPARLLTRDEAIADPGRVRPGMVFILSFGNDQGHTGFVDAVTGGNFTTIEGNSNPDGSRNGIGVFQLSRRTIMDKTLLGFIDFT